MSPALRKSDIGAPPPWPQRVAVCHPLAHHWPVVSEATHKVGDVVKCLRCDTETVVRCRGCGGLVTL